VARLLSALESLATVCLTAELARRLFGRSVAILTALFLAISLLPVREAHFGTVDSLLVALVMLTLLLGERLARRGSWRDYLNVSVALALAAATKIIALLAFAPIVLAHAWKQIDRSEPSPARRGARSGLVRLLFIVATVGAIWLALNPYALLDPQIYWDLDRNSSLRTQSLVVRGELPVLYTLHFINETPYWYVIADLLRWGMGLPLELLALAGVGYSLWRLLRSMGFGGKKTEQEQATAAFADAYLLSWLLIYVLVVGSWYAQFVRYALPLVPVLCLLAGRLVVALWQRGSGVARIVSAALAVSVFVSSLGYTVAYLQIYRRPDVRIAATEWLKRHVPAGSSILIEKDEALFLHRNEYRKAYGLTDDRYRWQVWNPYEIDGVKSVRYQPPAVSEARTRAYLETLLTTDYVVISQAWRDRFLAAAARFPAQAEFYRDLFGEKKAYRLARAFNVHPQLGPLIWPDDGAEMTFRLFDHPTIYVFSRDAERLRNAHDG
jgi:4-amino-4-deoxy-L-arabinose transferase-like glycosyltransferase